MNWIRLTDDGVYSESRENLGSSTIHRKEAGKTVRKVYSRGCKNLRGATNNRTQEHHLSRRGPTRTSATYPEGTSKRDHGCISGSQQTSQPHNLSKETPQLPSSTKKCNSAYPGTSSENTCRRTKRSVIIGPKYVKIVRIKAAANIKL